MRSAILCGMLAAAATISSGAAQTTVQLPDAAPDLRGRFDVAASARVTYDSNVARSDAALAASRGIQPQDEIFAPQLSVDLAKPVGPLSLLLKGAIGYDFYGRNEHLNRERIDLSSGFAEDFGYCNSTLGGNFGRHQSDLLDLTQGVAQNVETVTAVSLSTLCGRTTGWAPAFAVAQEWWRNSAAAIASSDFNSFSGTAGLGYRDAILGYLSIVGSYEKTEYPHRLIQVGSTLIQDTHEVYSVGPKWDETIGPYLEIALSPSYTSLRSGVPGAPGFEGITYHGELTARLTPSLRARFTFTRAPQATIRRDVSFSDFESYMSVLDYTVDTQWIFEAGGSINKQRFKGAALVNGVDSTNETINAVFASVRYALSNRVSLSLDARREDRDANLSEFNYKTYIVGLNTAVAF